MSRSHNPPHPGATLREDVLPALGLSVTEAAFDLWQARKAIDALIQLGPYDFGAK